MRCPTCDSLVSSTWFDGNSKALCYNNHSFYWNPNTGLPVGVYSGDKMDIYSKFCPACSLPVAGTNQEQAFCAANHTFGISAALSTARPLKLEAAVRLKADSQIKDVS